MSFNLKINIKYKIAVKRKDDVNYNSNNNGTGTPILESLNKRPRFEQNDTMEVIEDLSLNNSNFSTNYSEKIIATTIRCQGTNYMKL